jgi:hypothetical protein
MGTNVINFIDDLPIIRDYINARVLAQSKIDEPVSAIEVGFQLCQAGWVFYHFDTRQHHERDGEWTMAINGVDLELPHWQTAYESAGENGASFILLSGERLDVKSGAGDFTVAGVFGDALRATTLDAVARGLFKPLKLRDGCQLDMENFDAMWAWPWKYEDVGRSNIIRNLPLNRLSK